MTREEAITILNMVEAHGSLVIQAKDMAIKALEQEPCEDAISRQALLDAFGFSEKTHKWGGDHSGYNTMMLYEIQDMIESAPSVTPQEPKYCDRNICLKNEYNGIGCDECEVTKSQEPQESKVDDWRNSKPLDDVLNKIKAEILIRDKNVKDVRTDGHCFFTADEILEIIDKYRNEVGS